MCPKDRLLHFHPHAHTSSLPGWPCADSLFLFQCSDGNSAQENCSLKRVAVVEDFFDIIYAMHVEMGADPGRAPKHAGQKKTYKAVSVLNKHLENIFTIQQTIINLSWTACRYMDHLCCSKGHKTYLLKFKSFQTMTGAEYGVLVKMFIDQAQITSTKFVHSFYFFQFEHIWSFSPFVAKVSLWSLFIQWGLSAHPT